MAPMSTLEALGSVKQGRVRAQSSGSHLRPAHTNSITVYRPAGLSMAALCERQLLVTHDTDHHICLPSCPSSCPSVDGHFPFECCGFVYQLPLQIPDLQI